MATRKGNSQESECGNQRTAFHFTFYLSFTFYILPFTFTFHLPFLTGHYRDSEELTLVNSLTLWWLLPVFPGSYLQASGRVGFKIDSAALIATKIWQGSPLIIIWVSPCLFKGIIVAAYQRIPWSPVNPGRSPYGGPPLREDMGHSR